MSPPSAGRRYSNYLRGHDDTEVVPARYRSLNPIAFIKAPVMTREVKNLDLNMTDTDFVNVIPSTIVQDGVSGSTRTGRFIDARSIDIRGTFSADSTNNTFSVTGRILVFQDKVPDGSAVSRDTDHFLTGTGVNAIYNMDTMSTWKCHYDAMYVLPPYAGVTTFSQHVVIHVPLNFTVAYSSGGATVADCTKNAIYIVFLASQVVDMVFSTRLSFTDHC